MKIILDAKLFDNPPSSTLLSAIVGHALDGRHRIHISDEEDPAFQGWLGARAIQEREEWELVLGFSVALDAREPAKREIYVVGGSTQNWQQTPPVIGINVALNVLSRPFRIYLENGQNDRNFILGIAGDDYKKKLLGVESSGFLEFANGGGITTLLQQIQPLVNPRGADWHRTAAMIDSDALQPGVPSAQSLAVSNFCAQHSIWCHQLQRRSIENYLPRETLRGWAYTGKPHQKRKIFAAFVGLSSSQREHYNMKAGFQGDADRQGPNCGTLFDNVAGANRAHLMNGFGTHIAGLFSTTAISQDQLRRDGSDGELRSLVTEILAMVR